MSRLSALPPVGIIVVVLVASVFERREDSSDMKGTRRVLMSHCPGRDAMHVGTTMCKALVMTLSLGRRPVEVDVTLDASPTLAEIVGQSSLV